MPAKLVNWGKPPPGACRHFPPGIAGRRGKGAARLEAVSARRWLWRRSQSPFWAAPARAAWELNHACQTEALARARWSAPVWWVPCWARRCAADVCRCAWVTCWARGGTSIRMAKHGKCAPHGKPSGVLLVVMAICSSWHGSAAVGLWHGRQYQDFWIAEVIFWPAAVACCWLRRAAGGIGRT